MTRIYHHYKLWEDYPEGFYNNCSGIDKESKKEKVVELFSNPSLTREFMEKVINEWVYSCEHNLTNESMNKVAYLGQAACCLFGGVPSTTTMEAWRLVPSEFQNKANDIAIEVINIWIDRNKNRQLCLNII
jgi:hypothetical protein